MHVNHENDQSHVSKCKLNPLGATNFMVPHNITIHNQFDRNLNVEIV
jgi:hypothetical protein